MKQQATKARAKQGARKQRPTAPVTRMLVVDALRSWVMPTISVVIGGGVFVVYNIGLVETAPAVTIVGTLCLAVTLFFGLRSFTAHPINARLAAVLIAFVGLWGGAAFYPFYRALNPGAPMFTTELRRDGTPVTVPMQGRAGHYTMIVEGHFPPAQGRQNRSATYHIAVGHGGVTDQVVEGTFKEEWRSQRVGAGRRSSLVPVMSESIQALNPIDDPDGRDLTLKLTDLSADFRDTVTVKIYAGGISDPVLIGLGVLALAGAMLVDAWRPKGESEGLMGTLTAATLLGIATFRASSVTTPGFPQFMIAALVGTLVGALAGSVLWRLTQSLKKHLPALA